MCLAQMRVARIAMMRAAARPTPAATSCSIAI